MEFDLTLNAIQTKFSLSDERIEALKNGNTLSIDGRDRTLKINKKKRYVIQTFMLFLLLPIQKKKKSLMMTSNHEIFIMDSLFSVPKNMNQEELIIS